MQICILENKHLDSKELCGNDPLTSPDRPIKHYQIHSANDFSFLFDLRKNIYTRETELDLPSQSVTEIFATANLDVEAEPLSS